MTIEEAIDLAFNADANTSYCERCLFNTTSCAGCDCVVGNVLKRLVDEGHLLIDEKAEKGGKE